MSALNVLLPDRVRRVLAALAITLVAITGLSVAGSQPANASVGCSGSSCTGKDPIATGCASGAYTVAYVQVYYQYVWQTWTGHWNYAGLLELRWSPACQTNWARFTAQDSPNFLLQAVQPSTGTTKSWTIQPWTSTWTDMIYSPDRCVYAGVNIYGTLINGRYVRTGCY